MDLLNGRTEIDVNSGNAPERHDCVDDLHAMTSQAMITTVDWHAYVNISVAIENISTSMEIIEGEHGLN